MNNNNAIKNTSIYPILILEDYFPHSLRHTILHFLTLPLLSLAIFSFFAFLEREYMPVLFVFAPRIMGIFLILFSFWLVVYMAEIFYRSVYFHNRSWKIKNSAGKEIREISSEVASIFYNCKDGDIIRNFFLSPVGEYILLRCGLSGDDIREFLETREDILSLTLHDMTSANVITMNDFALYLFKNYEDFSHFLFKKGVGASDFAGAVEWATRTDDIIKFAERWWSRENLSKFGEIGRDFGYGHTYRLEKYAHEITIGTASTMTRKPHWSTEVEALSAALAKSKESNALIVGDDVTGLIDIVYEFAHEIDAGTVQSILQNRRILVLDTNLLTAATKEKGIFEEEIIRLLNETARAGNVILVFENFPSFITSAETIGTNVIDLLGPYLSSPSIKIIALAETEGYHRVLAPNGATASQFEKITVKEPSQNRILELLEDGASSLERKHGVFFTFRAIEEVLRSAQNYITEGVMPNKATDLLIEIAAYAQERDQSLLDKEQVLEFVRFKTHIPVGEISPDEKKLLEHLEDALHKRVVGQNSAVKAVADAMRRSRAGVRNSKKPIGSFLFLGPTGVGKTETAKSLASVFFESEDHMMRFDMSEYSQADAMNRLIGGFESGKTGTLTMALKNFPYGVLLLDEFEKANKEVHDLFLAILDEGFFSDMGGHRVNARNLIIIATSNAGSDIMYEAIEKGEDLSGYKEYIIDTIIKDGKFRAELINRFDSVILFHPLEKTHLREIARIQLTGLAKRLKEEQGLALIVNDLLVEMLVKEGRDQAFGGRPLQRAIKDKIEKIIANKIIHGDIKEGSTIELTEEDIKT